MDYHGLSTIEQADRIVVLDGGHIVESSAHKDLLAAGGAYARLYSAHLRSWSRRRRCASFGAYRARGLKLVTRQRDD